MMRHRFISLLIATGMFTALTAFAGGGWHKLGDLTAGGEAKELGVNRSCEVCLVKVMDGNVVINTIVVREDKTTTPVKVGARIGKGESREINLGGRKQVKGFRISDDGGGRYQIYVK